MKNKTAFLLMLSLSVLFLSGCQNLNDEDSTDLEASILDEVDTMDGVSMSAVKDSISPTGLTVEFENDSDRQVIYSEDMLLEENISGSWYQVPVVIEEDYGFNDIGYELDPEEQQSMEIYWEWLYGELDDGQYRLVKRVLDFRGTGDFDENHLTAEFEID
ncbi:MAG: immunoglobulin-like domain-containing protein [Alkalibacterium sp.]